MIAIIGWILCIIGAIIGLSMMMRSGSHYLGPGRTKEQEKQEFEWKQRNPYWHLITVVCGVAWLIGIYLIRMFS